MRQSIIRINQVEELTGVPRSTLYKWIKKGAFPAQLRLGPRSVGWNVQTVNEWIEQRQSAAWMG